MWTHCPGRKRFLIRSSIVYAVVLFDFTPDFSFDTVAVCDCDLFFVEALFFELLLVPPIVRLPEYCGSVGSFDVAL